jgi:PD-(D/E)XK nuclease superfamily
MNATNPESLLDTVPAYHPEIAIPTQEAAPSPFLPGTHIQFAWDSTSLGYFKTCPRLYQYQMVEGWRPKSESVHLRFGSEYHKALEEYDTSRQNGVPHEDAIHDVIHNLLMRTGDYDPDPNTKAGKYKSKNNLVGLVVDYLDHFGMDDPARTVILMNGKPATEVTFKFELEYGPQTQAEISQPYLLCGHIDRIVEFNDTLMVMDRKTTTATLSEYYFKQYEPNNQMTLYTIATKALLDSPVKGVIIDAAQILLEQPHVFQRGFTYRTPDQMEEWLQDLRITLANAEAYATANYWPMNDTACDKFGGCPFREVCNKSPQTRKLYLETDFNQLTESEKWNPLAIR